MFHASKHCLLGVVFITGACVLVLEVAGLRMLSPHFGNTIYTFSSVLCVFLAALSVGYYFGGRLADRHPEARWFFCIIAASGLGVGFLHWVLLTVVPSISRDFSLVWGPLLSGFLLFFLPCVLLGTLSPYVIRLIEGLRPDEGIGELSGQVFFCSTIGSISGTLFTGFYLVPNFGLDKIIVGVAVTLFVLGALGLLLSQVFSRALVQA